MLLPERESWRLGLPVFICAEIGQNHNGSIQMALEMVKAAKECGVDAVKLQKRTPHCSIPRTEWDKPRETPWGSMTYLQYRQRLELSLEEYQAIDALCREIDLLWFASAWDLASLAFLETSFPEMPMLKVPSAKLTNLELLAAMADTGKPMIVSTGMSTEAEIEEAVSLLSRKGTEFILCHCTSAYPCPRDEINLRYITILKERYPTRLIGYSGHEVGLAPSLGAVALGACYLERHFTLDRSLWGTDQAASVEPGGLRRLCKDIRLLQHALGDGIKRVYESELLVKQRLRGDLEEVAHG